MSSTRRHVIRMGGGLLSVLLLPPPLRAREAVEIVMGGTTRGSHVWFDPIGLLLEPGQTVRWINRDQGNAHTATAYHPDIPGKPRRIPRGAAPWNSDYLLPGDSFAVTLTQPGVYDYFCIPHEQAGMVGRIVVGTPQENWDTGAADSGLPEAALRAMPPVEEIIALGAVRRE